MTARAALAAVTVALVVTAPSPARACPCSGAPGPAAALTADDEVFGASVAHSAAVAHGAWSARGRYAPLDAATRQSEQSYQVSLAARPSRRVEIGGLQGWGVRRLSSGEFHDERVGFGDPSARVRLDVADEPMPWMRQPWPAVAVAAALRAPAGESGAAGETPLGRVASGTTGSSGAAPSSQSLGAWEGALALELRRSLHPRWTAAATFEAAARLPDRSLGIERRLGPRLLGQAALSFAPDSSFDVAGVVDLAWEDDVALDGAVRRGTAQRLLTLGALLAQRTPLGWRAGLGVRHAPALDGVNVNALRVTSVEVSLGWSG